MQAPPRVRLEEPELSVYKLRERHVRWHSESGDDFPENLDVEHEERTVEAQSGVQTQHQRQHKILILRDAHDVLRVTVEHAEVLAHERGSEPTVAEAHSHGHQSRESELNAALHEVAKVFVVK